MLAWLASGETPKHKNGGQGGDDGGRWDVDSALAGDPPGISEAALKKAEEFIEADEGALNRLSGTAGTVATTVAVVMSLFHLYAAIAGAWPFHDFPIIATQPLRYAHVAFVLVLSFLLFPMALRFRNRIRWWDVVLGLIGAAILIYAIDGGEDFTDRATSPTQLDTTLGVIFIVLLLEATRRTTGLIVPVITLGSSPTPISGRICRSRGRTAASTSARSSVTCSSRWKASSAFRSTCRRR